MAGRCVNVLRIASAAALVVLAAAGCGSSARRHDFAARGLPPTLAQEWAARASAIAAAAAAGNGCYALQLAGSLRDEVIAKEAKLPARLRSPLVSGVNALADRITCTTRPETVTVKHPPHPKPHHKPPHEAPGHHGPGDKKKQP